jgi:putative hydrolase of the HAD superfamily
MRTRGLVIFDAFNTLVTAHADSQDTFLAGLRRAGLDASQRLLAKLQAACEGLDHSVSSGSRQAYVRWAEDTLSRVTPTGASITAELAPRVIPALEQLHQAPMVPLPDAVACLRMLKEAGFVIAVCSNWGWDLSDDLGRTGLTAEVDIMVTSAQVGFRKPHPRIYQFTMGLAGFRAEDTVFLGDSLRADVMGPQRVGIRSILLSTDVPEGFQGERADSLGHVPRILIDHQTRRMPSTLTGLRAGAATRPPTGQRRLAEGPS